MGLPIGIHVSYTKSSIGRVTSLLNKFPDEWQRNDAMMAIMRKASKPLLVAGRANLAAKVPNLGTNGAVQFSSRADSTKTIMRSGLVNKGDGKFGSIFNSGTVERKRWSAGGNTGKIKRTGWWDDAVGDSLDLVQEETERIAKSTISRFIKKYTG